MCGRYSLAVELPEIVEEFHVDEVTMDFHKRYNIAPTQRVAGIVTREGKRYLEPFHWGLIPSWASDKKIAYKTINARSETVQSKPAFRSVFTRKRVILCASSFYEWKTEGSEKQPFAIGLKDRRVFGFAGLYDTWRNPDGDLIQSATILTTEPNSLMEPIHNRMPVILDAEGVSVWLDPDLTNKDQLQQLLIPFPEEDMKLYPVSKKVGSVKNESPDLLEAVDL